MSNNDINLLKIVTDSVAESKDEGRGRWDEAEEAVNAVLHVLYETASGTFLWQPIYEAIRGAYATQAQWSDDAAGADE